VRTRTRHFKTYFIYSLPSVEFAVSLFCEAKGYGKTQQVLLLNGSRLQARNWSRDGYHLSSALNSAVTIKLSTSVV
jgi:hypothetical protein